MGQAFSELLSPAVGVAISPLPIVGLILFLLGANARSKSLFYMIGWLVGCAAMFLVGMYGMNAISSSSSEPSLLSKIINGIFGALLLFLAVKKFLNRPKEGAQVKTPKWFEKVDGMKPLAAAGMAILFSALNPKNLLFGLSAGVAIGSMALSFGEQMVSMLLFVLIAGCSILIPTLLCIFMGHKADKHLETMRIWLIQNNDIIMALVLLMLALKSIGKVF